ncbi:hypothetical protein JR316_0010072 [Psilocybe cubensis]|uniref:Uncharacterized protein n=2 Tax=Psilocybe cubensis TaxID=181762 RepID=A0ACB8GQT8_PSICU|nr:hypothetical protein JR316_0010072 [Psilocybe cubensis]KAH9477840.1 hypothetical protein JR316_0010072 [Psilocybe cubensis]
MMDPIIVANSFVFCKRHGDEYCHLCTYDHRFTNNYQIQDDPALADLIENGYDLDNRQPINIYDLGGVAVGRRSEATESDCKCRKHGTIDCNTCFNWVEYIKNGAKEAESQEKWLNKREKYYKNRND